LEVLNQVFMKKLLRYIIYTLFLGVLVHILASSCQSSSYQNATNLTQLVKDCRVVQHVAGETCVPQNPERVVTIFHATLGNALSLGIKPIASSVIDTDNLFPAYLQNKVEGIEVLGSQNEPNLERILMLKPDLILVWQNLQAIYPLLSQISPTAIAPWRGPSAWREHFEFVAKALGKEEEARQAWEHYYQRIDELKIALGNRYKNKEISVVAPSNWGYFIQARNSFIGSILDDLELKRPKLQDVDTPSGYITFSSEEKLELIDGDILFVLTFKDEEREAFEKTLQNPLGERLRAVQQGQIRYVDGLTWGGSTLLAADVVIDELYKYLVNTS
jgi:iron complex transport system substrate-binding protein